MNIKNTGKIFLFVALFLVLSIFSFYLAYPKLAYSYYNRNSGGKYFFNYYNCIDCHAINGIGGTLGPSLSNYGNKGKSYRWTLAQIENSRVHFKVGSKIKINDRVYYAIMPSYNYISKSDIKALMSYLYSLKK